MKKKLLKLFSFLGLFFTTALFAATSNEDTLKELGEQGAMIGGTTGLSNCSWCFLDSFDFVFRCCKYYCRCLL